MRLLHTPPRKIPGQDVWKCFTCSENKTCAAYFVKMPSVLQEPAVPVCKGCAHTMFKKELPKRGVVNMRKRALFKLTRDGEEKEVAAQADDVNLGVPLEWIKIWKEMNMLDPQFLYLQHYNNPAGSPFGNAFTEFIHSE